MKTQTSLRVLLALTGSALLSGSLVNAASVYWDGATGSWNTTTTWTTAAGATTPDPGAIPGALDDLIFNRTGVNAANVISLNADQAALSLTFDNTNTTTFQGNTSGTTARALTIGSGGITVNSGAGAVSVGGSTGVVNIALSADQIWTNNSTNALSIGTGYVSSATSANVNLGANLTITGSGNTTIGVSNQAEAVLTGSGSLTKTGTGFLQLGGNNTGYSGNVIINGGVVNYGDSPGALGTGNLLINGGVLEARWSTGKTWVQGTGAGQIQITGGVSGFGHSNNAIFNIGNVTWGSATFAPTEFVLHGATAGSAQLITFSSAIDLNGANRTIRSNQAGGLAAGGSGTFSGAITNGTGTAGLIKEGVGTHILTGTNTYNGGTTINGGVLRFGSIAAMPNSGAVTVNTGATLGIELGAAGDWTTGASGVGTLGGLLAGLGGAGASTVTYSGNVGLNLHTTANSVYSSNIADVGSSLMLINTGTTLTLTLSGNNSYSGGTTLASGILIVGSNTAIPNTGTIALNGGTIQSNDATARSFTNAVTIGGNFTVGGTGNMTFSNTGASALGATRQITVATGINATFAQAFTGSTFGITKAGAGTLTLTGANTYTGVTTINAGTIVLNNDGDVTGSAVAFGGNNTGLTVTGGSGVTSTWNAGNGNFSAVGSDNAQVLIDGAGTAGSAVVTNVNQLIWGRTATNSTITLTNGGQMSVNGEVRIGNSYYSTAGGANLTIGGGTATSTFSGDGGDDFYIGYGERRGSNNNVVTVNSGGVLTNIRDMFVGNVNNQQNTTTLTPSTANKLSVTGTGTASMRDITVGYAQNAGIVTQLADANANVVEVTSGGQLSTSGVSYIGRANNTYTESNANTLTVTGTGSSWNAGNQTVYVGHTANATATSNNNILTVGAGGTLTNVSSLIVGFGTGTETGNQLVVNGTLNATTVTINAGNSLSGSGAISGAVTVNGALTPGNSPGQLTFNSSLDLNPGSTTTFELGGTTLGTLYDNITLGGAATALIYDGSLTVANYLTYDMALSSYVYDLFSLGSLTATGDFSSVTVNGLSLTSSAGDWTTIDGNVSYLFSESTGDLAITVIPEPTTALLGCLGLLLVLRRRR